MVILQEITEELKADFAKNDIISFKEINGEFVITWNKRIELMKSLQDTLQFSRMIMRKNHNF